MNNEDTTCIGTEGVNIVLNRFRVTRGWSLKRVTIQFRMDFKNYEFDNMWAALR
jgi:hypothetical protein